MVDVAADPVTLADLDEEARNAAFDRLQARMPSVWEAMRRDDPRESVVVVPSMTLDRVVASAGSMSQALEERFLFFLLLLRQPRLRMVYVTSQPINPLVVEYYLSLLPGEERQLTATFAADATRGERPVLRWSGWNVAKGEVTP
jgi:hypothetical protein